MRVAVLGQFPLDLSTLAGVEVAIVYLMDTLRSVGVDDLHIVTCRTELSKPQEKSLRGVTIHYLPRQHQGRLTWHLRENRRMGALLREIQPDIVHGHSTGLYAGAALDSGFPNVITAHGIVAREVPLYQGAGARLRGQVDVVYERYCLARAKDLIAISPYVQQVFQPLTQARFHLVENAVDNAFFGLVPQPQVGRLLLAGAVIERKGLLPLVQALARVKEDFPQVDLRVAGSTSAEPKFFQTLTHTARDLGVDKNISFLGQLDQDRVLDEYAHCSVFVMPSFQETAPMAVQQALAAGVPAVATPAGGVPWLIDDGATGLLVKIGDVEALAGALRRLLGDEMLRAQMGLAARSAATARFLPQVVAEKTKLVYDEILARTKS